MPTLRPVNKSYILQTLCESNFYKLFRLAPGLLRINKTSSAQARERPTLYLQILERNPYTLTMELTHRFDSESAGRVEPAVKIRIYLDAKSAEVLHNTSHRQNVRALQKNPAPETILDHKWTINYFLERWLDHCIEQGYRFGQREEVEQLDIMF